MDFVAETTNPDVYACGDVVSPFKFTHTADWSVFSILNPFYLYGASRSCLKKGKNLLAVHVLLFRPGLHFFSVFFRSARLAIRNMFLGDKNREAQMVASPFALRCRSSSPSEWVRAEFNYNRKLRLSKWRLCR